jgi:hypothetical protein
MAGGSLMNRKRVHMELADMDSIPGPYTMSFGYDQRDLVQSIREFGLINPPFVIKNRAGGMDIVMGYRRVLALNALGWKRVLAYDLTGSEVSGQRLLLWNLYDNMTTRSFNPVEKGMILKRLVSHFTHQDICDRYLHLLGITSVREMDLLIRIEELDIEFKQAIANNRVSLNAVKHILEMDAESRTSVFTFISNLNLNVNQQIQLMDYIEDISRRENQNIHQVLAQEPYNTLLHNPNLNNPQKAKRLFMLLKEQRYPMVTQMENAFKKTIQGMNLPRQVHVIHPPYFEASDYKMEIRFKGGADLKETIDALAQIEKLENLSNPWDQDS